MFSEDYEIIMYCDMHGHSMKKNVFMYACSYKTPGFGLEDGKTNIFIRLVPFLLSKRNKLFSYGNCHFRLERFKEATARIVNFKEFNILASYTLEASFFGPEVKENEHADNHMDTLQLESLGRDLCKQLTIFLSPKDFSNKLQELSNYLNSPSMSFMKRRATSARRKETIIEDNEEIIPGADEFNIKEAIKEIPEENFNGLSLEEEKSDSGGSDLDASNNDEKKIMYLLAKGKSDIHKKKHEKHRSLHICQNHHPSNRKFQNYSISPDVVLNSRSKSRMSSIKKSYQNIILKPQPKKTLLKSPCPEESITIFQNFSSLDIKPPLDKQRKIRERISVKTSRGDNGFIISSLNVEKQEPGISKVMQKILEKHQKANFN